MRRIGLMMLVVLVVPLAGLALAAPAKRAQPTDFTSLLSGKKFPLSLKLKELNSNWRRFTMAETGGLAGLFGATTTAGGAYYTKGVTVTVASETFLVAYRQKGTQMSVYEAMMSGPAGVEMGELTADSPVTFSLLNLRNLVGMNDIRPFNLEQELKEYKEASEKAASMAEQMGGTGDTGEEGTQNLKQLGMAVQMYVAENDVLPPLDDPETAKQALMDYVANEDLFTDPETEEPYAVNSSLSGKKLAGIEKPSEMVVFYQAEPGADGKRGVALLDGSAKRVTEEQWQELKASSGIEELGLPAS